MRRLWLLLWLCGCGSDASPPSPGPSSAAPSATVTAQPSTTAVKSATRDPEPVTVVEEYALPSVPDARRGYAYLAMKGVGIVAVTPSGKASIALDTKWAIHDLRVGPDGIVWAAGIGGSYRLKEGKGEQIGDDALEAIAPTKDGAVGISFGGVFTYQGQRWTKEDKARLGSDVTLLEDITVDKEGRVYVLSTHQAHRRKGDAWERLTIAGATREPYFKSLVALTDGTVFASASGGIFAIDGSELTKKIDTGVHVATDIEAGENGELAAITGLDSWVTALSNGKTRDGVLKKFVPGATRLDAIAIDASGRRWLGHDNGLTILDPNGNVPTHYRPGSLELLRGRVEHIAVVGAGPELPVPQKPEVSTIKGRIVRAGQPVGGASIEMCAAPSSVMVGDATPCAGASAKYETTTSEGGDFSIPGVVPWSYAFAVKESGRWVLLVGAKCCSKLDPGKILDVGALELTAP